MQRSNFLIFVARFTTFSLLVSLDLISKFIVFYFVDLNSFISLTFFLDLTHIHNFGVSFGLFANVISPYLLVIMGLLIVSFIFFLMLTSKEKLEEWGLLIIISGAISNIIDRIYNGYVIDFIYFHYKDFYWPAFNFADIYITFGILVIFMNVLIKIKKNKL